MKQGLVSTIFILLFSTITPFALAAEDSAVGHDYVVQSGDGLYSLGRKFYGKGIAYKKILAAHNVKAASDSRYLVINENQGLEVGQLIWVPVANPAAQVSQPSVVSTPVITEPVKTEPVVTQPVVTEPVVTESIVQQAPAEEEETVLTEDPTATAKDDTIWPSATIRPNKNEDGIQLPQSDQATIVEVPKTNCQIRIWYNYQIVAISALNKRWKALGMSLIDRAHKAFQIRHDARVNGRFMMQDKFEVAALRDRDNKKYGNPDGPTFEHLVDFTKEKGFTGDAVYRAIIESTSRTRPVFNSSCVQQ